MIVEEVNEKELEEKKLRDIKLLEKIKMVIDNGGKAEVYLQKDGNFVVLSVNKNRV